MNLKDQWRDFGLLCAALTMATLEGRIAWSEQATRLQCSAGPAGWSISIGDYFTGTPTLSLNRESEFCTMSHPNVLPLARAALASAGGMTYPDSVDLREVVNAVKRLK